jgi:hypothetical protein
MIAFTHWDLRDSNVFVRKRTGPSKDMAGREGDVKYPLGFTAMILPGDLRDTSMESLLRLRVVGRWFQTPGDFELHFIVTAFPNYWVVRAVPCRTFCVDWVRMIRICPFNCGLLLGTNWL